MANIDPLIRAEFLSKEEWLTMGFDPEEVWMVMVHVDGHIERVYIQEQVVSPNEIEIERIADINHYTF